MNKLFFYLITAVCINTVPAYLTSIKNNSLKKIISSTYVEKCNLLLEAVSDQKVKVVKAIIENISPSETKVLSTTNFIGNTPLHIAAYTGNIEIAQILINALLPIGKKMLNRANSIGNTPLHIAAYSGEIALFRMLKNAGASITIKNQYQETPIDLAFRYLTKPKIVEMLYS